MNVPNVSDILSRDSKHGIYAMTLLAERKLDKLSVIP